MTHLVDQARNALRQIVDPEASINIVDLGLIYDISENGDAIEVLMTLTTEACPFGPKILIAVEEAIAGLPGSPFPEVLLTFDPPWTPERITAEGRKQLE